MTKLDWQKLENEKKLARSRSDLGTPSFNEEINQDEEIDHGRWWNSKLADSENDDVFEDVDVKTKRSKKPNPNKRSHLTHVERLKKWQASQRIEK